jgi:PadR family transcriptional regulator, regulatory protein PadR
MKGCEMKGFLSFLLLWMVSRKPVTGAEITSELEKRKGTKPSPGTIYPALKDLSSKGFITADKKKRYTITKKGASELHIELKTFFATFSDVDDMKKCCRK